MISRRGFFKRAGALTAGAAAVAVVGLPEQKPTREASLPEHLTIGSDHTDQYDVIVSSCWADEVAAWRGVEGQTFTTLNNNTFRVYSTVGPAIEGAQDGERIYVAGGTYREPIVIPPKAVGLTIVGATFVA